MKLKNQSKFCIFGLNQEKILNKLVKKVQIFEITRVSKQETTFVCSYFDRRKVQKILNDFGAKWEIVSSSGFVFALVRGLTSYGMILAFVLSGVLWAFGSQFVLQYEILGLDKLTKTEIVEYVKENFPAKKENIDTTEIELALVDDFERISFASCIIKGQTLVINIKEKLLPSEMYGTFAPITASKSGRITSIQLVSGTLNVNVGDFVQEGDVLVLPYVIDSDGNLKKVEACATIYADVYNVGSADHYQTQIVVERTGNLVQENSVVAFGLTIYTFKEEHSFAMYEVECEEIDISKNLFLPFKLTKTYIYELRQRTIESSFEDCREEVVANARKNALESVKNEEDILEEYHTIRHIAGVTIVNYTIVTQEVISNAA